MRRSWVVIAVAWALALGAQHLPAQTDQGGAAVSARKPNSVKAYFDRARKLGFPAIGQSEPYILRAEFTARASSGEVETGTYTDTWLSDSKWRRDAVLAKSTFVRSRDGKRRYRLDDGPDAALLQFVLTAMEPIPVNNSVRESKWTAKADVVDGVATTCISRSDGSAGGGQDANNFEAYWFDDAGQLVKTHLNALETRRSDFQNFNGVHVARRIEVVLSGKVGMRIDVTQVGPAGSVDASAFTIKGHSWTPAATAEAR